MYFNNVTLEPKEHWLYGGSIPDEQRPFTYCISPPDSKWSISKLVYFENENK